jgi:hypothetical protein
VIRLRGDGRSRRVAVVPDAYLNPAAGGDDRLVDLAEDGWGVVALPQPGLPDDVEGALLRDIADQLVAFLDGGYQVGFAEPDDPMAVRLRNLLATDGRHLEREL